MLPETVDRILNDFTTDKARCAHIEAQIAQLEHEIERLKRNAAAELVLPARAFDGMPRGNAITRPTENTALRLADGYEPEEIPELRRRIEELRAEKKQRELNCTFTQAWLTALPERERFIIEHQTIQKLPWRIVIQRYTDEYGIEYSKDTLKRWKKTAQQRIYAIAV